MPPFNLSGTPKTYTNCFGLRSEGWKGGISGSILPKYTILALNIEGEFFKTDHSTGGGGHEVKHYCREVICYDKFGRNFFCFCT